MERKEWRKKWCKKITYLVDSSIASVYMCVYICIGCLFFKKTAALWRKRERLKRGALDQLNV